jgi:hypothetical protein
MAETEPLDWVGNNAAFRCPDCKRVFIVSWMLHRSGRPCPDCEKWTAVVSKQGRNKRGSFARIEPKLGARHG